MAIGTTSKRPGSSASMTERAETTDTWCSAERPPYTMASRILAVPAMAYTTSRARVKSC